jgi:hypothetical protein
MKKVPLLKGWKLYVVTALLGYPSLFLVLWLGKIAHWHRDRSIKEIALFSAIGVGCVLISFAWADLRKR